MLIRHVFALLGLVGLLAACQPATPATPAPTPVIANADWSPIMETFDGIDMMRVPAGCFVMGSEDGRRDERPAHDICFTTPYWIGRTEVTNGQYNTEGHFPGTTRPRENLTWFEARDFCASKNMRLPTEAEWEYAARGVDQLHYPWGDDLIADNLVFDQNSNNETANVGSRPAGASWVGALDMSGNVFEWTSTIYSRYPYDGTDGRENLDDPALNRVFRGGINSYIDFGASAHTRFSLEPDTRDWFIGFRCAKSS